jgi:hypothetical protein
MGGQPWPELELPWAGHGELAGEEGEWEVERERGCMCGAAWGGGELHEGHRACSLAATAVRGLFVLAVREKKEEGRRKEKEKKRKNMKFF